MGNIRPRRLDLRMLESLAVPAGYDRAGILARLDGIWQDPLPGMAKVNIRGLIPALKDRGGPSSPRPPSQSAVARS